VRPPMWPAPFDGDGCWSRPECVCSKVLNTLPVAILWVDPTVLGRLGVLFASGNDPSARLAVADWEYR
jgi:hypothetical protein